jgi:hypothetical protein
MLTTANNTAAKGRDSASARPPAFVPSQGREKCEKHWREDLANQLRDPKQREEFKAAAIVSIKSLSSDAASQPHVTRLVSTILFDLWAQQWRQRHAGGGVIYVRYADDMVVGFGYEDDAQRFLTDLRARLEAFALSLHPDKARLLEFGRFAAERRRKQTGDVQLPWIHAHLWA